MTWWITKFDDFINYDNQRKREGPKESQFAQEKQLPQYIQAVYKWY